MSHLPSMHDWLLASIDFDWGSGMLRISVNWDGKKSELLARGVTQIHIPRKFDWGPSASINKVEGPHGEDGALHLAIEMQSGDIIEVLAASFEMKPA